MINQGPRHMSIPPSLGAALFGWVRVRGTREGFTYQRNKRVLNPGQTTASVWRKTAVMNPLPKKISSCPMVLGPSHQPKWRLCSKGSLENGGGSGNVDDPQSDI